MELRFLTFGEIDDAQHEENEKEHHHGTSYKAPFFAYRAKNIIGVLFGHKTPLGLGAFGPAFSKPASTANCDLTLVGVIANSAVIHFLAQNYVETVPVTLFKNIFKTVIHTKKQGDCNDKNTEVGECNRPLLFPNKVEK